MVHCRMAAHTFLKAPCLRLLLFLHDNSSLPDIIQDALPAHTTLRYLCGKKCASY